jgi:hypothetical protein
MFYDNGTRWINVDDGDEAWEAQCAEYAAGKLVVRMPAFPRFQVVHPETEKPF